MDVSICCVIKDEQDYLDEWIRYHLSIGFDDIYVFEDYNSTPHDDICSKYDKVHLIKVCDIEPKVPVNGRQFYLYTMFANTYHTETDWAAFIDVDEFIVMDKCTDIHKFMEEYEDEYGVYLYWKMYYANGRVNKPDPSLSVFEAYPEPDECFHHDKNWDYKSIVNLKKCYEEKMLLKSIHEGREGVNTMHIRTSFIRCYHKAWINHYFTKSWEDWVHKMVLRGDIYPGNRKIDDFFTCNPDMLPLKDELYDSHFKKAHDFSAEGQKHL